MSVVIAAVAVLILVFAVIALVGIVGRRRYQEYSGREQQRAGAKRSRTAAVDRLKAAETALMRSQRALVDRGDLEGSQEIEELRRRLAAAADRQRYAGYGYAPLGSDRPVRSDELAHLEQLDSQLMLDSEHIVGLSEEVARSSAGGGTVDLSRLLAAVDDLDAAVSARRGTV
jgi:hypothetical protein